MIFDLIYFHFQFDQFVSSVVHRAFSIDGLATSHPIYVPVYNPDEINEIFDAISYDKVRITISAILQNLVFYIQSNLYIKVTQGNLKMWPL